MPVDISTLPANVQQLIGDLRKENAGHRTAKNAAEQRLAEFYKAVGLNPDGSKAANDPAAAAQEAQQRAEQAEAVVWRMTIENQVHRLAGQLGADAAALLDSVAFVDSLEDIVDADPTTPEFASQVEAKIRDAVTANAARYQAAAGQIPPRSGASIPGAPGGKRQLTEQDLKTMTPEQIVAAQNEGLLDNLLRG